MFAKRVYVALCITVALTVWGPAVSAHALPDHTWPQVGNVVDSSPRFIRVWFKEPLRKASSHIRVENAHGVQVTEGRARIKDDGRLLERDMRHLRDGKYHVYWSVTAVDGHRTRGDFVFWVKTAHRDGGVH